MNTRYTSLILGVLTGLASVALWIVFAFFNPYSHSIELGSLLSTFIMLCLPACLAIFAAIKSNAFLLMIAFVWSLPVSIYLSFTPGIFALFGTTSVLYLISYIFIKLEKRKITYK